ncbi:MAG: hypothetical protein HQK52_23925 [Oligoflexia bacterium]|nr:hypothetical protein [Oligoflexia bacterium]
MKKKSTVDLLFLLLSLGLLHSCNPGQSMQTSAVAPIVPTPPLPVATTTITIADSFDKIAPSKPSNISPSTPLTKESSSYTPTFTPGTDLYLKQHEVKACLYNDCTTACTSVVAPAGMIIGLKNGYSYYICVQAVDLSRNVSGWVSSFSTVTIKVSNSTPTPTPTPSPSSYDNIVRFQNYVLQETNFARTRPQEYARTRLSVEYSSQNDNGAYEQLYGRAALPTLILDARISEVAMNYASLSAQQGVLGHDLNGTDPSVRCSQSNYHAPCSENLASHSAPEYDATTNPEQAAINFIKQLIIDNNEADYGHRKNILDSAIKAMGVGYARNINTQYVNYFVQNFGRQAAVPTPTPSPSYTPGPSGNGVIVDVCDSNFTKEVIEGSANRPVLVDYMRTNCGNSQAAEADMKTLASRYAGRVKVVRVNLLQCRPMGLTAADVDGGTSFALPAIKLFYHRVGAAFRDGRYSDNVTFWSSKIDSL